MFGFDGDMSIEDLIPEEEMVVTVTRGGYIKRTRSDNYRNQHRGGNESAVVSSAIGLQENAGGVGRPLRAGRRRTES